jgi:hypothetical protein
MAMNEELVVDADGIPILTELVHEYETGTPEGQPQDAVTESPAVIADRLLKSRSFQQQIEQVAATLSQQVHDQVEQSLRPALEEAINLALEDSSTHSAEALRQQLESSLPELLARALEK